MTTATPAKPAKSAALKKTPTSASTAVALKSTGGSIVSLADMKKQMAIDIASLKDRIAPPTGIMVRATQDKKIVLPDGTKTDGELQLVIVDFVSINNYYRNGFDKDNIVPPDCYAVGPVTKNLVPASNAPDKQSNSCAECPMNMWDSGPKGKGKACSNERLMAVMEADATPESPVWLLKASKTAIKGFDGYVSDVSRLNLMPIEVVTTVGLNPAQDYPSFVFSDPVPNTNLKMHYDRRAEARSLLMAERDVSGYQAAEKAAPVKKQARR